MIYRTLAEVPEDFGPCAITIGNFDGVHMGHQEILRRVRQRAREYGWRSAALTFDPHPTKLVAPDRAPKLLATVGRRARLMEDLGIERVMILPFTSAIANLSPETFVREILAGKLKVRAALVGDNFRFGNRAAGDAQTLGQLGARYDFTAEVVETVALRSRTVSSTEIRLLIESGQVSVACRLLGRPYSMEGRVVRGEGVGAKQTVPTLNLETKAEVLPRSGVYITRTRDTTRQREWPSITNIGYRPTFNGQRLTIETYLLTGLEAEPPAEISVQFLRWVREERKFENPEALKAQIIQDVGRAQRYFARLKTMTNKRASIEYAKINTRGDI